MVLYSKMSNDLLHKNIYTIAKCNYTNIFIIQKDSHCKILTIFYKIHILDYVNTSILYVLV